MPPDPKSQSTLVADYATPARQRPRLTVGEYVFYFVAIALFLLMFALPFFAMGDRRAMYNDFKLKLPAMTVISLDALAAFRETQPQYWLWIVPAVAPLLLARLPRHIRDRALLIAVLLVGCAGTFTAYMVYAPFLGLIDGTN